MSQVKSNHKLCLVVDENTERMINIIKQAYGFKTKSHVIRMAIARLYEELIVKKIVKVE